MKKLFQVSRFSQRQVQLCKIIWVLRDVILSLFVCLRTDPELWQKTATNRDGSRENPAEPLLFALGFLRNKANESEFNPKSEDG